MRFTAIFPFIFALAAVILSLLCLFSGSTRGFLQNVDILTLNTSMIGHGALFNTSDGNNNVFSNIFQGIEGDINNAANKAASSLAHAVDIHDFYSAYILDYCEGYYEPNATAEPGRAKPHKNYTSCSNRTALFHFHPTKIIESELKTGINLSDIKWPDEIEAEGLTVESTASVMFVLYCIGIAISAIAVIGAVLGFCTSGLFSAVLNFMFCLLGFLALGLASALSTVVMVKGTRVINKHGSGIGIAAYMGKTFLGMTWAATALMLLAAFYWFVEWFSPRRPRRTRVKEKELKT